VDEARRAADAFRPVVGEALILAGALLAMMFGFRRRSRERLTGVVQAYSADRGMAWIAPHLDLSIIEIDAKVLRRSRLSDLKAGDRVEWDASQGDQPRRLYRYRRAVI
jgi:cold shock CspA family protein